MLLIEEVGEGTRAGGLGEGLRAVAICRTSGHRGVRRPAEHCRSGAGGGGERSVRSAARDVRERVRHGLTLLAAAAANGSCAASERAQPAASGRRQREHAACVQTGTGGRPMDGLRACDMLAAR